MTRRRLSQLDVDELRLVVYVVAAFVLAAALDYARSSDPADLVGPYVDASVFGVVWTGVSLLAQWIAQGAQAIGLVQLAQAVGWLAAKVASILINTGAMFARVWQGLKVVWSDVLRPAIGWIDSHVRRLYAWLHDTFRPVFTFLQDVRQRLFDLYRRFVRPVLDTIDFVRAINRVLVALHIHVLEGLDRVLAAVEQRIDHAFSWVLQQLTKVFDLFDKLVTGNGIFQKWILVASLRRYTPTWIKHFWEDQIGPVRGHDGSPDRTAKYPLRQADVDRDALAAYFDGAGGTKSGIIDELGTQLMQIANGVAPTTDDQVAADELLLS